jgi:DNA mismatch endonuclease (patch repair protein)
MSDFLTKTQRSKLMSCIHSSGNKDTELRLISIFRAYRITGWRRNYKLPGKPDFVFPYQRLAVFVDGCYWHGCPKHYTRPKSNRKFWDAKIARNRRRDREVGRLLLAKGWRVLRIWEHALARKNEKRTVARVRRALDAGAAAGARRATGLQRRP